MVAIKHDEEHHSSRLDGRQTVLLGIKLRRKGECWLRGEISDMSVTGFRLRSFVELTQDMDLWVMFPGFEGRRAIVKWIGKDEAGCQFDTPLHPAIFDHIIRMSDPNARG